MKVNLKLKDIKLKHQEHRALTLKRAKNLRKERLDASYEIIR